MNDFLPPGTKVLYRSKTGKKMRGIIADYLMMKSKKIPVLIPVFKRSQLRVTLMERKNIRKLS